MKHLLPTLLLLAATAASAQIVLQDFTSGGLITSDLADDTTLGNLTTNLAAVTSGGGGIVLSTAFNGNQAVEVTGNTEPGGKPQDAFTYAFSSTGLTGEYTVSFDVAFISDGVQGSGDPDDTLDMDILVWGEVHPWNSSNTVNLTAPQDNGGFYVDSMPLGAEDLDLTGVTTTLGGSYKLVQYVFDLGPSGFDHGADGGTPGADVLYVTLNWENMSAGDAFYLDNFRIDQGNVVVPEPSTYAALFGLAALGYVYWRRRR